MKAKKLDEVDHDYRNHVQAFLNYQVQAQKRAGKNKTKPVYRTFKQFYNYELEVKKAKGEEDDRFAGLKQYLKDKDE